MDKMFRVIQGTYPYEISRGSPRIIAAPNDNQPFPVDAVAFEEDTFLVLSAETAVREPKESLMRVMTRLIETHPETPGSVLVRGKHPLRMLAIVHDLNQEPTWKNEWVESALRGIFQEAERRRLESLALPFIGTLHGKLGKDQFVGILGDVLACMEFKHLRKVWLVVPSRTKRAVLKALEPGFQKRREKK
ncbi:MAG: hypothetical protein JRJ70_10055 [Deltaproteobacteria bacterium]|nr:hypothetical protein [Deltaproteobacteria bacterium]